MKEKHIQTGEFSRLEISVKTHEDDENKKPFLVIARQYKTQKNPEWKYSKSNLWIPLDSLEVSKFREDLLLVVGDVLSELIDDSKNPKAKKVKPTQIEESSDKVKLKVKKSRKASK